ncbi:MAG: SGNH/GDSL hydrolase family protein [Anaerolineae bacterium]|nr:SGNH/GDSL hydrolase family protein [Anaerolineae bacterium]
MERNVEIGGRFMKAHVRPLRLVVKALLLFALVNVAYAVIQPPVSRLSLYNVIFPGRIRFPFDDGSSLYTVMIDDAGAMLASHEVARPKPEDEYRVLLIGDSSIWGEMLPPQESISAQWNILNDQCKGKTIKFYNLGYPHPSVIKDLIILEESVDYDPDLIVWFTTLNSLIPRRISAFMEANREDALRMMDEYDLAFPEKDALAQMNPSFYGRTLIGQRSNLNRWFKLQMLGFVWSADGTDLDLQYAPETLEENSPDVESHVLYRQMEPTADLQKLMVFEAFAAGREIAGSIPILIVNEPMFIASGENSDLRYNKGYPRWAYDQYREAMQAEAIRSQWNYLDLWNTIPPEYFSDTALHLSAEGERLLIEQVDPLAQSLVCK